VQYAYPDSTVRIAKVDSTVNEISGHSVTKFPTLQLFRAGAKDTPITYSGDRSLGDLMSFLRSNGVDRSNDTRESGSRVLDDTLVKDEL
jgi:hypothetical protein